MGTPVTLDMPEFIVQDSRLLIALFAKISAACMQKRGIYTWRRHAE